MTHTASQLTADALHQDSRIAEGKRLLLEALKEHQSQLTGVRAADPERAQKYEDLLDAFAEIRGGKLWYPYLGSGIGNGPLVELLDGSVKYDFISGIGVHYLGHSHPAMTEAAIDAALTDILMQGHLQQNKASYDLSELLVKESGMDRCFLSTSGVMANENALKILFQKRHPAQRLMVFEHCFMGRTLAVSQLTDKPAYREGLPSNILVDYVPYYDWQDPEGSLERALRYVESHLKRYPGQYAAMIFEMVQGEGGFYPGTRAFFEPLMQLVKDQGIPVMVDEVQTFARTPQLFAFQHFELQDYVDIVTIGKVAQVCATLYRKELQPRPGLLSQTFSASSSAIHGALAIIRYLLEGKFYGPDGKIARYHTYFAKCLEAIGQRHPNVLRGPYGIGSMVAFTPLDGGAKTVQSLCHALFDAGVIGFMAGANPSRIRFLVPYGAISEKDIDAVCAIVEKVLLEFS